MSSISNSNSFSVGTNSYASNGLSGLVSGMDTESMVKKMLSGTQTKIDKQNQNKTQLQWKQEIYQDIISDINTFSSKYFDSSYGSKLETNLASASFFNSMKSSLTSGSSVKVVSSDPSASQGDMSVIVSQLASAAKIKSSGKISGTQTITGSAMNVDAIKNALTADTDVAITLTLDGTPKTLTFSKSDFPSTIDATTIKSVLDTKLTQALGSYVKADMSADNKLTFSINLTDSGHELSITGTDALKFGITPGASTLISGITKLGDLAGISGKSFSVNINGTSLTFSADDTVSVMMNKINSSTAGVKISYSSMADTFSMETSSTGEKYGLTMSQQSGNLMSVLFGADSVSAANKAISTKLNTTGISGTALASDYTTDETKMTFKVNGTSYTFSLARNSQPYTKADVETHLNSWLKTTFGETDGTANISYSDGQLNTAAGYEVAFDKTTVDTDDAAIRALAGKTDLAIALGFSTKDAGASNAVNGDTLISSIAGLNPGSGLQYFNSSNGTATKLSEISSITYTDGASNTTTYDGITYADGRLTISNDGTDKTFDFSGSALKNIFGTTVQLGSGALASGKVASGQDAILIINDNPPTSRSSNTFTVDGITLTATNKSTEKSVISTTRDADVVVNAVKSFVKDYNTMVSKFYKLIKEDPDYRDYPPATDTQKDQMSDKDEERWEVKAKTGLVRSDNDISTFLTQMGSAVYKTCEKAGIGLFNIGIETSASDNSGQLKLDETALRKAIAADPSAVETLFTDKTDGFAKNIISVCDDIAKLSSASPGKLVTLAGAKNWSSNAKNNDMYRQLKSINDKLDQLKVKYKNERTSYWSKFTAMEKAIASYSSQSGMLTSLTGSQ